MPLASRPWYPLHVGPPPFRLDVAAAAGVGLRWTGTLAAALLDLALPPRCPACRGAIGTSGGLCVACWKTIRFLERPWCERLGTPFPYDLGPGTLSAAAIADPPVFDRARSAVAYDGPVPDLVQALKYADRTELAPMMAAWMARAGHEILSGVDALVPVPLHRRRLLSRRFNQAALLAGGVARIAGLPCRSDWLIRRRQTRQQVGLSRESRAENVRGAFAVPPRAKAALAGRTIVLVDDVMTTGATLEAATRTLKRAGAARVDVLTLARAFD